MTIKKNIKKRVVVAMSGGVDSSVAAALLQKQGYEVIGVTMCFGLSDSKKKKPACCGIEGIEDARRVAHKLGIKHYVLNFSKQLIENVVNDFISEYLKGRTPNPCVRCNQYLKFDALLKKALSLDADYLATGHYARITHGTGHRAQATRLLLKKGKDKFKDQTYFLYRLDQDKLKHILFPLGGYTKEQVRQLAKKFGLAVADKPGSQEICFIPDADYRSFLKAQVGKRIKPGVIVDTKGNLLGKHKGIAFYTVGQREGLGIACGHPAYITKIIAKTNTIVVGTKEEVLSKELLASDVHFVAKAPKTKIAAKVKIRYNHKEAPAKIIPSGNRVRIQFTKPQFAVTAGQAAVFYDKDTVIGGGIIELE